VVDLQVRFKFGNSSQGPFSQCAALTCGFGFANALDLRHATVCNGRAKPGRVDDATRVVLVGLSRFPGVASLILLLAGQFGQAGNLSDLRCVERLGFQQGLSERLQFVAVLRQ